MDYLSRKIEYSNLVHELEIGGENHLEVILKDSASYLKRAEEVQTAISSDKFLSGEDKERMLKELNGYIKKVKPEKNDDDGLLALLTAGLMFLHALKGEGEGSIFGGEQENVSSAVLAFRDELKKYLL